MDCNLLAIEIIGIKWLRNGFIPIILERCYYQIHDEIYKIIKDLSAVGLFIFPISRFVYTDSIFSN